jgi:glycosyltransferase involved in cell wall biosynthesis
MSALSEQLPVVPVAVTAKNEERAIAACLESLRRAVSFAAARLPLRFDLVVALNDCTDRTEDIVRRQGVPVLHTTGGLVEAQRAVARSRLRAGSPFLVFSDADICVAENALQAVARVLLERPEVMVAYPSKTPLSPCRRSLLARALYVYNLRDGFQTRRRYFNGKFFAIRHWYVPAREELQERIEALPPDRFYGFHDGIRADDVYLSRWVTHSWGPEAIAEVPGARLWFRPPETLAGMYRYYRRMRMEIERLDLLFPELRETHRQHGVRSYDWERVRQAPARERWLWRLFRLALLGCKIWYLTERFYYRYLARGGCPAWPPVEESKQPIESGSVPRE